MAKRRKTKYPGVFWIEGKRAGKDQVERIYYVNYYRANKRVEEKVGRQYQDDMTPAKANSIRTQRIEGVEPSNRERREAEAKKKELKIWTVEKLFKEYEKNNPNRKDKKNDPSRYNNYIGPHFGSKQPNEIAPLDVDRLRLKMLKNRAPSTVKNTLELLRRICNFGAKKNLCEGLSFTIEMPKSNNIKKNEDLTDEQLKNLLAAIEVDENPHAGDMMLLALYSGMRRGELFKLKWQDIDFKNGFIHLKDPKGGQDQKIPLNDASRELLENRPRFKKSPFVFPGRGGKQRTDINKAVNEIKTAAGLPKDFRPLHGLRVMFATTLAGRVDMYTLQKLLTHKSPITTQKHYAYLRDQALKDASNLAAELFKPKKETDNNIVELNK